jgi:hypothetical protein
MYKVNLQWDVLEMRSGLMHETSGSITVYYDVDDQGFAEVKQVLDGVVVLYEVGHRDGPQYFCSEPQVGDIEKLVTDWLGSEDMSDEGYFRL